jgi:hypothetical protein
MKGKVKCTCGWSWNKSDSSVKDMYICHECGRDNSNNMKNGGWLDNYNDSQASAPEGMVGDGFSNVGRNYSPAWGGQFQNGGKTPLYVESKNDPRYIAYQDSLALYKGSNQERVNKLLAQGFKYDVDKKSKSKNYIFTNKDKKDYQKGQVNPKKGLQKIIQDGNDGKKDSALGGKDDKNAQYELMHGKIAPIGVAPLYDDWWRTSQYLYESKNNNTLPGSIYDKDQKNFRKNPHYKAPYAIDKTGKVLRNFFNVPLYKKPNLEVRVGEPSEEDLSINVQEPIIVKPTTTKETTKPKSNYWTDKDVSADAWKKFIKQHPGAIGMDPNNVDKDGYHLPIYEDKQRPKVEALQPLTPQPIISNLFSDAKLPVIRPEARMPKSYDVNSQRQTMSGPSDYYNYNQEGVDYETAMRAKAASDAYNADVEKRYGPQNEYRTAKSAAEAAKRLKQLRSEFNMTPNYQMGGNVYPVNYVPQAAMGASMPGAVGFTYARTKGIPSNGPYAKKTMASAKNGGWLDQYDEAQDGERVLPNNDRALKILANIQKRKQKGISSPEFSNVKIKDERALATKPAVSTAVKKRDFDLEQSKDNKAYNSAVAAQKAAEKKEAARRAKLTKEQREREDYNAYAQEHGSITQSVPETNWERTKAIVSNPMTAIGYKVRGENLPGRFQYGPRNEHDYAVDWINPLQGAVALSEIPGELSRGEFLEAGLSGLDALDLGVYARGAKKAVTPLVKKGVKQLGNIPTNVSPGLRGAIPATSNIKSRLKTGLDKLQQSNTYKAIDEHVSGIELGLFADKRPFFEKFPITKAQKAKVYAAQDKALEEGKQFIKDWHYRDDIDLHPDIVDKIKELDPNFKLSIFDNTNITNTSGNSANPFAITNDALVSTRRNALKNENISDDAKQYILDNRNRIGGVNLRDTNESLTLRNRGLYHYSPLQVKDTVIHEAGHTSEHLGTPTHYGLDRKLVFESKPFDRIRTYDPDFTGYYMANPNTDQGKIFQEAMVEPTPHIKDADGNITKKGRTWEASPGELHSELLPARSNLIDAYEAQGHDRKEIMDMLRADPSDAQIDWMIENKNLNRFFKPTTSPELKRKAIRMLYAGVPAAVGLDAITGSDESSSGMRQGGIIRDDRGQWAYPGEITEIGSNDITMKGVPYDVLGISDTGDTKLMKPGKNYKFKGKKVTEFPMAKNGLRQEQKGLVNLDQLTNFTNYNKPQPGGWLNKYN